MDDLTGQRFGRLLVTCFAGRKQGNIVWKCLCDCGNTKDVLGSNLRGKTKSCGCLKSEIDPTRLRTHGLSGSVTHRAWKSMMSRCYIKSATGFKNYGGRGIKVCDEWHKFENFFASMGECLPGMSLDRIDTNGHYKPENCRWATRKTQSRNKRNNRLITVGNTTATLAEWSEKTGFKEFTIRCRIKRGWTAEEAVTIPVISGQKYHHFNPFKLLEIQPKIKTS